MTRTELLSVEDGLRQALRNRDQQALSQWAYSHGIDLIATLQSMIESYDLLMLRAKDTAWGGSCSGYFITTIAQTE